MARTFGRLSPLCPLLLNKTGQVRKLEKGLFPTVCLCNAQVATAETQKGYQNELPSILIELNQCKANARTCSRISLNVSFPDMIGARTNLVATPHGFILSSDHSLKLKHQNITLTLQTNTDSCLQNGFHLGLELLPSFGFLPCRCHANSCHTRTNGLVEH